MKMHIQGLRSTDQNVLEYLNELTLNSDGETCTVSIPKIASACNISERQVQISTKRLIEAGLIERIGYDFSNPDLSRRGTIYKILFCKDNTEHQEERAVRKGFIKFFLYWSED